MMFFACTLLHRELRDYSRGQVAFAVFQALLAITQLLCHVTILILISQIYSLILLVLPGATSSNYLNLTQGYYADPIIFSID